MTASDQSLGKYVPGFADVWSLLEARAAQCADRTFIIWQPFDQPSVHVTYAQTAAQARAVAAGLQKRGVVAGDRVLVHLENSPEFIIACLACAAVGATAVTTNTRSARDELAFYASDSGAVGAITQPRFADLVAAAAPSLRWQINTEHDSGIPATAPHDSFADLLKTRDDYRRPKLDLLAPLIVQYTSGTTARPKGVVWTNANALWTARINAGHEDLRPTDRHYTCLPLFHANAMSFSVLPTLWVGGTLLLTPKWSTSRFWQLSQEHRCTWLSLVGISVRALMSMPAPQNHCYRMFGTGVCFDEFPGIGVKTIGWWGMTETVAPGIVGNAHAPNRPGAIGKPAPQYQIAVVRDDSQDVLVPVEPEEPGHLLIKGVSGISLFAGYLNNPEATARSFTADGWFRTGDLVKPHADGFISFVDRHKDMLRVGAENVAAAEIERVIAGVPGVTEAAVIGRPDEKLDEVPVAFVTAAAGCSDLEQRVSAACRRLLADFKVPRAVYVVSALPRSTISKIDKVALRAVAGPDADRRTAERGWAMSALSDPSGDADG